MPAPRVLIVTATTWLALARLPEVLAREGAEVALFGNPNAPAMRSRFVRHRFPQPWSPQVTPFVDALRGHLEAHQYDWVILGDDLVLLAARGAAGEPWLRPHLPIDLAKCPADVMASKIGPSRVMEAAGMPVPAWREARSPAEALEAARELGWPVILKPDFGLSGSGVAKATGEEDFPVAAARAFATEPAVIVQKFIPGRVGSVEAIHHRGRTICWSYSIKARTHPGPYGGSTMREFVSRPEVADHMRRFGEATGYHGFAGFDTIEDADGNLSYIEVNMRPTAIVAVGQAVGIDIAGAVRQMLECSGEPRPTIVPPLPRQTGPRTPMFPQEVLRIAAERDWGAVPGALCNHRFWRSMPWRDLPLWRSYLGQIKLAWHTRKR